MSKMNYGIVRHSFWTGQTGRKLRGDVEAQIVALYLMTSPHGNSLGVYRCPLTYLSDDIGIPIEGASKSLKRLIEAGFCTFDAETETVWVLEMARYQIGDSLKPNDKRQVHIQRIFAAIENDQIQQWFFAKYGDAYQLVIPERQSKTSIPFQGALEGASLPQESSTGAKVNIKINSSGPSARTPVASPNPDAELFRRGKDVLGRSAGGQIVKLKAAKGGNVALARAAIEQASTKHNPAEYIAAVVRGGAGPPVFGETHTNGFVAVMEERAREQQHGQPGFGDIINVTPTQPSGSDGAGACPKLIGRE